MVRSLLTSNAERQEAELEQALRSHPGLTPTNTIAAARRSAAWARPP